MSAYILYFLRLDSQSIQSLQVFVGYINIWLKWLEPGFRVLVIPFARTGFVLYKGPKPQDLLLDGSSEYIASV